MSPSLVLGSHHPDFDDLQDAGRSIKGGMGANYLGDAARDDQSPLA
jgi:hypothetical protein